jgi:KaiC/GvpD/RAD55 family RecA-like ATPase
MGLLKQAEKRRHHLLNKLSKSGKKYIEHVSAKRKNAIFEEIKKQRRPVTKAIKRLPENEQTSGKKRSIKKKSSIKRKTPRRLKSATKTNVPKVRSKAGLLKTANAAQSANYPANSKLKSKYSTAGSKTESKSGSKAQSKAQSKARSSSRSKVDISSIAASIREELRGRHHEYASQGKNGATQARKNRTAGQKYVKTGISGFDALLEQGIPKGAAVLVAGGAGSGKTILTLQALNYHAVHGDKCLYMSFEESEAKLVSHMQQFGWNPKKLIKDGKLLLKRFNPFDVTRSVDALLMKSKGELLIDVKPIVFPKNFKPDIIVVDSLTAIASAFTGKEDSYRIYIEQLFRFFEEIGATSFLITETTQMPTIFSTTGVEEFLADAVVVIYNIKRGNIRERAIEVLKLRGGGHKKKIVAMNITSDGVEVFPEQEIFGGVGV